MTPNEEFPTVDAVIELNGRSVPYTLRVGPRARRARLEINAEDGLKVIVPRRYDRARVKPLLTTNAEWILKHLDRFAAEGGPRELRELHDGAEILFRGEPRKLRFLWVPDTARQSRVREQNGHLVLSLHRRDRSDPARVLEHWLRLRAREALLAELGDLDPEGRYPFDRVYIKDQRTRWGACSGRRNLSFNWRLILAPPRVLRYIAAHELAHLKVPNHSDAFWAVVGQLCRDYRESRRWLRQHGGDLHL
jgi:hypothetical protein